MIWEPLIWIVMNGKLAWAFYGNEYIRKGTIEQKKFVKKLYRNKFSILQKDKKIIKLL